MEQKDYILREIQKISILLRYLLGKILPVKSFEEIKKINEEINQEFLKNLGYDLEALVNISKNKFDEEFGSNKGFNLENIELLADLLYNASVKSTDTKQKVLKKSLELYEYVNETGKTFSFEREIKIGKIKNERQ
jgi:hypothetical protein